MNMLIMPVVKAYITDPDVAGGVLSEEILVFANGQALYRRSNYGKVFCTSAQEALELSVKDPELSPKDSPGLLAEWSQGYTELPFQIRMPSVRRVLQSGAAVTACGKKLIAADLSAEWVYASHHDGQVTVTLSPDRRTYHLLTILDEEAFIRQIEFMPTWCEAERRARGLLR